MCRTAEEIRNTDYTCIALNEYILHRKKQVNGDKESLAYFDVLRAEASIENRIISIQTKEDVTEKFEKTSKELGKINRLAATCKKEIGEVDKKLEDHLEECKKKPPLFEFIREQPLKFWGWVTGINLLYFVILHLIQYWVGFEQMIKNLFSLVPGVEIP